MTAVAILHRDEILAHVASGMILREIAPLYGVSKQSLHIVLKDDPAYREAMKAQAHSMIEEAKADTWAAREPHDIARAREIARFAFRYAESVDNEAWGQKTETRHGLTGDLEAELRAMSARMQEQDRARQGRVVSEVPAIEAAPK